MGDKKLPGIESDDIGKCAFGIFKKGDEYIGKWIVIAGEHLTGNQMAASMSRALDQEITYNAVEPDVFRSFGFPGAEDLGNMFQFKRDFEDYFFGVRNLDVTRSLNPDLKTFNAWLEEKKDLIPIPIPV